MNTYRILTFPFTKNPQGYSPWELWKHENIDAEDAATICGENPWENSTQILERKACPAPARKAENPAMARGRKLRPLAMEAYKKLAGIQELRPANLELKSDPRLIAHPDLFRNHPFHATEIHSGAGSLNHAIQYNRLPKPYWAEAQHTLMVCAMKFMHVFLYDEEGANHKKFTVNQAPGFQKDMASQCASFLKERDAQRAAAQSKQRANLQALKILAAIKAIKGQGPRLPLELFRELVPSLVAHNGQPTPQGEKILMGI
jgi:hypothetical protein